MLAPSACHREAKRSVVPTRSDDMASVERAGESGETQAEISTDSAGEEDMTDDFLKDQKASRPPEVELSQRQLEILAARYGFKKPVAPKEGAPSEAYEQTLRDYQSKVDAISCIQSSMSMTVTLGQSEGSCDLDLIQRKVKAKRNALRYCHTHHRAYEDRATHRFSISWRINDQGFPREVELKGDDRSTFERSAACFERVFSRLNFVPLEASQTCQVSYDIELVYASFDPERC